MRTLHVLHAPLVELEGLGADDEESAAADAEGLAVLYADVDEKPGTEDCAVVAAEDIGLPGVTERTELEEELDGGSELELAVLEALVDEEAAEEDEAADPPFMVKLGLALPESPKRTTI